MKKLGIAAAAVCSLLAGRESVQSQTLTNTTDVSCILKNVLVCPSDFADAHLHSSGLTTVLVDGYYKPGDQGGGTFIDMNKPNCNNTNGGSVIADVDGWCYQRINSTYGPKEFGAKGSSQGIFDDTAPIQAWLNASQPHKGDTDTYLVSSPLTCTDTTVQGPANLIGGKAPLFGFQATGSWGSNTAVIQAQKYCRLSGVGIDANNLTDGVDVYAEHVAIDGFSAISNGNPYNVNCV